MISLANGIIERLARKLNKNCVLGIELYFKDKCDTEQMFIILKHEDKHFTKCSGMQINLYIYKKHKQKKKKNNNKNISKTTNKKKKTNK